MNKGKYWLSGFILLGVLTASVYFVFNDEVRIDITKTRSIFKVYEDGEWVISGIEYVNLFDGAAKMRAKNRSLETIIGEDNITRVTRIANYKDEISTIEIYTFNPNVEDVELFPISHSIQVLNAEGKLLQYEVQKLLYTGETVWDVSSPQSFGHKMKVEWQDGNYYSRIYKYKNRDEGKLTIKYRIDSDDYSKNVRLFDPPSDIIVLFNSPANNSIEESPVITFNATANTSSGDLTNISLWTNESGSWEIRNTTIRDLDLVSYYKLDNNDFSDDYGSNDGSNFGTTNTSGIILDGRDFDGINDYIDTNNKFTDDIGAGAFSINAWYYDDGLVNGNIFHEYAATTGFYLSKDNFNIFDGSSKAVILTSSAEVGWHMITGIRNSTGLYIYLDGVLNNSNIVVSGDISQTTNNALIGRASHIETSWFNSSIDEVGIWDEALTTNKITELYNSGNGKYPEKGLSILTQTFDRTITDTTLWNFQACNSNRDCNFNSSNYTIDYDHYNPVVNIVYPENINYVENISNLNYTILDDYPDSCWYSIDNGVTNSSNVSAGVNFTGIISDWNENIWTVYCNDTNGQIGSDNITFNKEIIAYTNNSDTNNKSGNFLLKDNVFVNVSVYGDDEVFNESNITFWLWTSVNPSYNITTYDDGSRTINWEDLPENIYFWNVSVCNVDNNCNTTDTRYYGLEVINLSIDGFFSNQNVELGTTINITGTSNYDNIYFDYPSYGINYSSGLWSDSFNLIIDWFKKILFAEGGNTSSLNYNSIIDYNGSKFNITSHQYDEVVNLSVNISGTNNPYDIGIFKCNTSTNDIDNYDRFFYGNLTNEGYIWQDRLVNKGTTPYGYNKTQNLTFNNAGSKYLYFYMDANAKLVNFLFNVSSTEYGFSFTDDFDNSSYIDTVLSNVTVSGGSIMPYGVNAFNFSYDNFNDSSINETLWNHTADIDYHVPSGWGYDIIGTTTEASDSLNTYIELEAEAGCPTENFDQDRTQYLGNDISWFNLKTIDKIDFEIYFDYTGRELAQTTSTSSGDCTAEFDVLLGNINLFSVDSDFYGCEYASENDCYEIGSSISNIRVTLTKQINTTWKVELSGVERHYSEDSVDSCGNYDIYLNWTAGKKYSYYDSCDDTITDITNEFYINPSYSYAQPLYLSNYAIARYEEVLGSGPYSGCYGCDILKTNLKIYTLNNTRKSYQNSTVVSGSIFDSSYDVTAVTMESTGFSNHTFYISGDNGDNWQNILLNTETPIVNIGNHMKWKADIDVGVGGYLINVSYLDSIILHTDTGFLSDVYFDVGGDGTYEDVIGGSFDNTAGIIEVNLSSASLSNAFSGSPAVAQTYYVPVVINSSSMGQLNIEAINLTYNPNPIFLNITRIQNFLTNFGSGVTNFMIDVAAYGTNAFINLTDLRFDYAGGNDTINVLAHNADYSQNVSRNITYYYSKWDYEWGPDVEWLYFAPKNSTSKDVTPYGQTDDIPILKITNYGYGGLNSTLSVYQNDSLACVNTTLSLNSSKSNGNLINESWVTLTNMTYLNTEDIFLWADYDCDYSTWNLFEPYYYFRQCCVDCICSEELI